MSLPPSLLHPLVCSAHRQRGDKARVLGTVAQDVWCLPTMQNRNQNGQGLFDRPCLSKRQRRDFLTGDTTQCLEDIYRMKGKIRTCLETCPQCMLYFECWSILRCWYVGKTSHLLTRPTFLPLEPISTTEEQADGCRAEEVREEPRSTGKWSPC